MAQNTQRISLYVFRNDTCAFDEERLRVEGDAGDLSQVSQTTLSSHQSLIAKYFILYQILPCLCFGETKRISYVCVCVCVCVDVWYSS